MLPEAVSTAELGRLFNVTRMTVSRWAKAGLLVRRSHGKFDLVQAVRGYRKIVEAKLGGEAIELSVAAPSQSARSRLTEAQAVAVETKNAVARGELVSEAEVDAAWAEVALLVRTAVMDGVERAAGELPHMSRADVAVLDRVMRGALTALRQPQT